MDFSKLKEKPNTDIFKKLRGEEIEEPKKEEPEELDIAEEIKTLEKEGYTLDQVEEAINSLVEINQDNARKIAKEVFKEGEKKRNADLEARFVKIIEDRLEKIKTKVTPVAGIDYLKEEEVIGLKKDIGNRILKEIIPEVTPKKGVHYFDGKDGKSPKINHEEIAKAIIPLIPLPENGKDGSPDDAQTILQKILSLDKKDIKALFREEGEEIQTLKKEILALRSKKGSLGGHGGTGFKVTTTTSDNLTFTLSPPVQYAELSVHRGGARLFDENGDFTANKTKDRVTSITLAFALNSGETLNVRAR